MNETNKNAVGYPVSELRDWFEGANGNLVGSTFGTALNNALGAEQNYIYPSRLYKGNKFGTMYNASNWFSYAVFLPSKIEVFGYQTFGDDALEYNTDIQFPIYQLSNTYRF